MDGTELTEVCRLCPSSDHLLYIFDSHLSVMYNMREVISTATGIEILECDIVSKKICEKCRDITMKIFEFRQDAVKHDRMLKERCAKLLVHGIKLPNTSVTLKIDVTSQEHKLHSNKSDSEGTAVRKKTLHPSISEIYKMYPNVKLPKKCFSEDLSPEVSLTMGEVESYFIGKKLDMKKFIYRPRSKSSAPIEKQVAKKRTGMPASDKTVAPLKISRKMFENSLNSHRQEDRGPIMKSKQSIQEDNLQRRERSSAAAGNAICTPNSKPSDSKENTPLPNTPKVPNGTLKGNEQVEPAVVPLPASIGTPSKTPTKATKVISTESGTAYLQEDERTKSGFIESLGLTPTVTTTKSQTMHLCSLCGSVHTSAHDLKRHSHRHMVCPFCKFRFKSLKSKQRHINKNCHIKKVMNNRAIVEIDRIELDADIRNKYKDAFVDFKPLDIEDDFSMSTEPDMSCHYTERTRDDDEETVIFPMESRANEIAEQLSTMTDEIIVLSDDEPSEPTDPKTVAVEAQAVTPTAVPAEEPVKNTSIVKPDVRIKNNVLLNAIPIPSTEEEMVRTLLRLTDSNRPMPSNKLSQTDLPKNKDIRMISVDGMCEFKHLKEHLKTHKVPIELENGQFSVEYVNKPKSPPMEHFKMDYWDNLPVLDANAYSAKTFHTGGKMGLEILQSLADSDQARSHGHLSISPASAPLHIASSSSALSIIQNIAFPPYYTIPTNLNTPQLMVPRPMANTENIPTNVVPNRISRQSEGRKSVSGSNSRLNESSTFRVKNVWELQ